MSFILIALAFQLFTWRDGVISKLYEVPCTQPDLIEYFDKTWKQEAKRAFNINGTEGIEACYIRTESILFVLDVKDEFRAHLIIEE